LPLALVGRFHEGIDLKRLPSGHRRFAGLEELDNLGDERLMPIVLSAARVGFAAVDGRTVVLLASAEAAKAADPAVLPHAHGNVRSGRVYAADRLAAGAHDRIEDFDAVDAVPVEIGMMLLQGA